MYFLRLALLLPAICFSVVVVADDTVQFNRDIRPILSDKCFACHGPDAAAREAELRLDERDSAVATSYDVQAIKPHAPGESELIARITSDDPDVRMPPAEHGKPLTPEQIELLKQWIAQGAKYEDHWSLTPLKRPTVPEFDGVAQQPTAIDAFLQRRLDEAGLRLNEPADPRTLIRRLSFDLTGLPPSPVTVEAFSSNPSDVAYRALVDELISSPHYGERLAIYWLDLVRYADTLGYHGDQNRSVSPYRDYVINAFNDNKPFDQFTVEQLAGDLLPDATLMQKVASTYNRINRASAEGGVQPKEYLAKYVADRVRTAGVVWLGSTLGCAECHDHKFDPFTAKDFYSFGAFFADIKEQGIVGGANHIATLPVPTADQQQKLDELSNEIASASREFQQESAELIAAFDTWRQAIQSQHERWSMLTVVSATSAGGAELHVQADRSILVEGNSPGKDTYTITAASEPTKLAALRLEVLPHDSLPNKGPGRASNGNFVVNQVELNANGQAAKWKQAVGSHSQQGFLADGLAEVGKPGWAILPQTGQPNQVVLVATEPIEAKANPGGGGSEVEIRITQNHGTSHTLGHFRLSVTSLLDGESDFTLAPPDVVSLAAMPMEKRSEQQTARLWEEFRDATPLLSDARERLKSLRSDASKLRKSITTTLATTATDPREIRLLPRGNWMDDSGPVVMPAVPAFLPQPMEQSERLDRLDLAQWLVSRDNPLVARALVNRLWMLYFGQGIARSVDDLGSQGDWPTHPELLDWLAVEFIESGWDIKHIVRLIVTSDAYRRSSDVSDPLRRADPFNRLLARQSRWRLDAEMVRDNALDVSGLLVEKVGGPSVQPYQPAGYWDQLNFPKRTYQADTGADQYRRGLYTHWQRTFLHPSLLAFDAPAREECTARRERSNTPLQSLVLLNDPTFVEAARVLAQRVIAEGGDEFNGRVDWLYRQVLTRSVREDEVPVLAALLAESLHRYQQSPKDAKSLVSVGLAPPADGIDPIELAAWTAVTRAVLNLHETITRY